MSIMDKIVDDSGGTMKKENINGKIKNNRKNGRIKSDSPVSLLKERTKEADTKHEESRNGKNKRESDKRSDSPGMDLSVFQPRGKRKCVLQNETKKQRDGWWSDEESDDNDEDDGEGDDVTDIRKTGKENKIKKKSSPSKKKKKMSKNDERNDNDDKVSGNHSEVQCYVFSTGMANRAGHAVAKGIYESITAYHHAQKWNTPYLCAEVHCRTFNASVEDEEYKDLADGVPLQRHEEPRPDVRANFETGIEKRTNQKAEYQRHEQALSVNSWQKETVIQAAKRMSRAKPTENELSEHNVDESVFQPKKFNSVKSEGGGGTFEKSDSEQSPQTVPKFTEPSLNEKNLGSSAPTMFPVDSSAVREERSRVKDLNSPPQLVPTFPVDNRENRSNSYPADITNVKEQLRYQSPKHFLPTSNEFTVTSTRDDLVRPTVLTMATELNDKRTCVRSSIDVAEQVLKESRSIYKPGIPILPTDIHPSLFLSRHSSSVPAATSSSLFSPTIPRNSSGFYSTHDNSPLPHHIPTQMSLYRHSLQNRTEYSDIEKISEKYRPLSSFSSYHSHSRPSSLPVFPSPKGDASFKSKSFSVESLTNGIKTEKEATTPDLRAPSMNDRHEIVPEHLKKYLSASDRLHVPNGLNIHNDLKRSLDEQLSNHIMERAQREQKFLDQLHEQRIPPEKHLHDQRILSEKERYYHRYPFLDPRSPVRIPGFLPSRTQPSDSDRTPLFSSPHISSAYTQYHQPQRYSFPNC